jgi:hypothetical protein
MKSVSLSATVRKGVYIYKVRLPITQPDCQRTIGSAISGTGYMLFTSQYIYSVIAVFPRATNGRPRCARRFSRCPKLKVLVGDYCGQLLRLRPRMRILAAILPGTVVTWSAKLNLESKSVKFTRLKSSTHIIIPSASSQTLGCTRLFHPHL